MVGKSNLLRNASVAQLCIAVTTPVSSQDYENTVGQEMTATVEDHQRYEAERRRQEQARLEAERRKQEAMRFETERLRQDNERREHERWRRVNERLRQVSERHEQEELRLENERLQRERAQAAAAAQQQEEDTAMASGPDVFEQLRTLGQLRDQGILTELEFQRLKKKVLQ